MSFYEHTASVEELALKLISHWSEEAKRFFVVNNRYDDAESLDDVECFIGYDNISLQSRKAPESELNHLTEQANIFRPLLETGTQIEKDLQRCVKDYRQGISHPILDFVRYGVQNSSEQEVIIEITRDSAYRWAKQVYKIDISEWAPQTHSSVHEMAGSDEHKIKPKIDQVADSAFKPDSIIPRQHSEPTEPDILLLTLAWSLDTFMEIQVKNWRNVMVDQDRSTGQAWFRGTKLNKTKVINTITPEYGDEPLSQRKIHDHISPALKVIMHQWVIQEPFKKGEVKAVCRTLFALFFSAIRAATAKTDNGDAFDNLIKSPAKSAAYMYEINTIPAHLSKNEIEACLNKYWP